LPPKSLAGRGGRFGDPRLQLRALVGRVEADVQPGLRLAGNDVGRRIADVDGGDLEVRRLEALVAVVQHARLQPGQQVDQHRHRIGRPVGIGDVALHALDRDPAVDAAAPADLDHVAQPRRAGRLADDAVVDDLALGGQRLDHPFGAVEGHAFLVAGDQETQRALRFTVGQIGGHGGDEGGDAALHVDRAAADQDAIGEGGLERRAGPGALVAHGHHIGVAGETEVGAGGSTPGVEVLDLAELHPAAGEADPFQGLLDDIHRAEVGRGDRRTADQVAGEVENVDHGQSRSRSLIEVLERVWASTVLTMTAQERLGPPCGSGRLPGTTTL
jgi:hypothetical protein